MPPPLRLAVGGATGRMGQTLARLAAADPSLQMVGGIAPAGSAAADAGADDGYPVVRVPEAAADLLRQADVLLDFSAPELLPRLAALHPEALAGRALVVGTTGLGAEALALLDELARRAPVLHAANFSVGVNLLAALVEQATRALGEAFDVEIVEAHHRRKADAPSGTALQLGAAVARARGVPLDSARRDGRSGQSGERPRGEIGFHAVRGGDVVGEHRVLFLGERERLELAHLAGDRAVFAEGALRAARWLHGRPAGRYTMRQVLGLG